MRCERARIRDDDAPEGARVLVDRLWPRGVSKQDARVDLWAKDLAPSTDLRRWFHADPAARFDEFADRLAHELADADPAATLRDIAALAARRPVVLLTDAKDPDHSHVPVIERWLGERLAELGDHDD